MGNLAISILPYRNADLHGLALCYQFGTRSGYSNFLAEYIVFMLPENFSGEHIVAALSVHRPSANFKVFQSFIFL